VSEGGSLCSSAAPCPGDTHNTLQSGEKREWREKEEEIELERKERNQKDSMALRGLNNVTGWALGDLQPAPCFNITAHNGLAFV
jgi:hypothetical protein